jgi:hypothetical protein
VELLVGRACSPERELLDPVAAERGMRVAVDESRNRAEPATVDLEDVAVHRLEVSHAPDGGDRLALAQDVRVLDDVDRAEVGAAERRPSTRGRHELRERADE